MEDYDEQTIQRNFTNSEAIRLAYARTLNYLENNRRPNKTHKDWIVLLHGPKPVTSQEDVSKLGAMFSKNIKNVDYVEIGAPEYDSRNGMYHQHCLIRLNQAYRFNKKPLFIATDGTEYKVSFQETSSYTSRTNDFNYYLKYMRKVNGGNVYLNYDNVQFLGDDQKQRVISKPMWENDIVEAMNMNDWGEVDNYMFERHPAKWLDKKNNFYNQWAPKHIEEIRKQNLFRTDLVPFKMDIPETQRILAWASMCEKNRNRRVQNLFVVGPSKTGKTEFVIQNLYLKHEAYLMKGDLDYTDYDQSRNYAFFIFDDVNYFRGDEVNTIKNLTSSVNQPIKVDIKYGHRIIKSRPIIHLVNEDQFNRFLKTIKRSGSQDWWKRNMLVIYVKEPLFDEKLINSKQKEESDNSSEDNDEAYGQMEEEEINFDEEGNIIIEKKEESPKTESPPPFINTTYAEMITLKDDQNNSNLSMSNEEPIEQTIENAIREGDKKRDDLMKNPKLPKSLKSTTTKKPTAKVPFIERMSKKLQECLGEDLYEQVRDKINEHLENKEDETMEEEQAENSSFIEENYQELLEEGNPNQLLDDEDEYHPRDPNYKPWGGLPEIYPGQHQGKPLGKIDSDQFTREREDGIIYD